MSIPAATGDLLSPGPSRISKALPKRIQRFSWQGSHTPPSLSSVTGSVHQHERPYRHDWQVHTASFYSGVVDQHMCASIVEPRVVLPLSLASCVTNSLVALGDADGWVRLLDTSSTCQPTFKDIFLSFEVHANAILDMAFSADDLRLATASGDQTARVIDMPTQTTIAVLARHRASLKQVCFQPGSSNSSVLVTSSRDGSVHIWDLRCKGAGSAGPAFSPTDPLTRAPGQPAWAASVNCIRDAHQPLGATCMPQSRTVPLSVTGVAFPAREDLLVTCCDSDASLKLWDLRYLYSRRHVQVALSRTAPPRSHSHQRPFGLTSLALSGDGSRLFAPCIDSTVYAFATSHLILGHCPHLFDTGRDPQPAARETRGGLGPLYGLRQSRLHINSFSIKCGVRAPRNGHSELLAVGSSDGSAILFPTDEQYLPGWEQIASGEPALPCSPALPTRRRGDDPSFLISQQGTPLVRGHSRELGPLRWTSLGELVTAGDDYQARCWREGGAARDLRVGGEAGGRRWGCGWAATSARHDEEEV